MSDVYGKQGVTLGEGGNSRKVRYAPDYVCLGKGGGPFNAIALLLSSRGTVLLPLRTNYFESSRKKKKKAR